MKIDVPEALAESEAAWTCAHDDVLALTVQRDALKAENAALRTLFGPIFNIAFSDEHDRLLGRVWSAFGEFHRHGTLSAEALLLASRLSSSDPSGETP